MDGVLTFLSGVLASLLATLIWFVFGHLRVLGTRYPRIVGNWVGEWIEDGQIEHERLIIERQIGKRFWGRILWFHPTHEEKPIEYRLSGVFVNEDLVRLDFVPKDKSVLDYGVGLYRFSDNWRSLINGHSVSFNFTTKDLEAWNYTIRPE